MEVYKKAKRIVQILNAEGYTAYFAGGWVRDYLLGHPSSDIDIATDAPLNVILGLFPRTILVGMAFGVIIVQLEGCSFEVATFRKDIEYTNGRKPDKIEMASAVEDAMRRDFTINGMFFDPVEEKVYDFVGGVQDLKKQVIRAIGDPYERFDEDRLRMIRAIRFSSRFNFPIEPETEEGIRNNAVKLLPAVKPERIYQEFVKMAENPRFDHAIIEMFRLGLLEEIIPALKGLHLNEVKRRVMVFDRFPQNTPMVAYLREVIKHLPLKEQIDILHFLKTSVKEREMMAFFHKAEEAIKNESLKSPWEWVYFYAHPWFELAEGIYPFHLDSHNYRMQSLASHIDRVKTNKPLVTSKHLMEAGISAGKKMGVLLKEAEKMSMNEDINDPEIIIQNLQESETWKE